MSDYRRHDLTDREWVTLSPLLPGSLGKVCHPAQDNRSFINGVKLIFRTGSPWRDLLPSYGHWKNVHRRFCRWRDRNVWRKLLDTLSGEPDMEWLMIDASHIKVHPHAAGAKGGIKQRWSCFIGQFFGKVKLQVD